MMKPYTLREFIDLLGAAHPARKEFAALEAEVARYKWWHDYVMSRSRANEFFDGYGNTLRLTPLKPTKGG